MKQLIILFAGLLAPLVVSHFLPLEGKPVPYAIALVVFSPAWQTTSYQLERLEGRTKWHIDQL